MRCACAQKIPNCWQQEQSFVHGISSDKAPKVKSRPKGSFIWMRDEAFRMRKNVSGPCRAHEFLPDMFVLRGGGAPYPKSGESPPHQGVLRRHGTEEQRVTSGGLAESPGDSGGSGPVSESEVASDGLSVVGRQILPRSAVKATRPGNRRRKWVGEGRRRWSESKNVDSRVRFIAWRPEKQPRAGNSQTTRGDEFLASDRLPCDERSESRGLEFRVLSSFGNILACMCGRESPS